MRHVSIKERFIMALMVTSLTSLVIASLSFSLYELHRYKKSKEQELGLLIDLVGKQSAACLLVGDKQEAVYWLSTLKERQNIRSAGLYNGKGDFFVGYQRDEEVAVPPQAITGVPTVNFADDICTVLEPLVLRGEQVGYFLIAADLKDAKSGFSTIIAIFLLVTVVSLSVSYVVAFFLHDQFKKPIVSLVDTARFICEKKDFKARARKYSSDEMGLLTDTINRMLDEIGARDEEMKRLNEELESRVETRTAALQEINSRLLSEKKRADHASTVKSDFLANMSHEIRTPMNGIVAACDLAMDEELTPKVANYLKIIQDSSHALLIIINDILDFSRLEAGTLVLDNNPFSLPDLLSDLNNFFSVKAHDENIDLIIDMAPDVPQLLVGDRGRFRQILYNLVDNGLKFTHEGLVSLYVSSLEKDDKEVSLEVRVRDTGVGLTQEGMDRIFRSFHQEDSSSTRQFGGTGLGLAISRQLARMMGGTIEVESELGKGATFIVTLRAGWRKAKEGEKGTFPVLQPVSEESTEALEIEGLHALIVEDNETNLGVAEAMLTGMGMTVDCAENGQVAVDKTKASTYDVIFMDMQMPVMDGYEAIQAIRKLDSGADVPIIAMTAHALAGDKEKCLAAGADGYISKPVHKKRLEDILETVLRSKARESARGAGVDNEQAPAVVMPRVPDACLLDIDRAIRQLGVREDVYRRVLRTFCHDYKEFQENYQQHAGEGNVAKVQKMVHSLKGSSATIGAETLSILAKEADRICKENSLPPAELADNLLRCLDEVLVHAKNIEKVEDVAGAEPDELVVKEGALVGQQLQDLADSLDQSMYDNINTCLKVVEGNISGKRIVSLSKMIRMYSYEDALALVHEIASELDQPLQ